MLALLHEAQLGDQDRQRLNSRLDKCDISTLSSMQTSNLTAQLGGITHLKVPTFRMV